MNIKWGANMGKCIRCQRTGVFLKMNTAGLCQECQEDLMCQAFKIVKIKDSISVIYDSKKYEIINNRVEYVINVLDKLHVDKNYLDDYFINFIGSNYVTVLEAFLSIQKDLIVVSSYF